VEAAVLPARTVRVRQKLLEQTATLLGMAPGRTGPSVLPELSLRGVVRVELAGLSRPVTLCAPPAELDPSPCLLPRDLSLGGPFAVLDDRGLLHFRDDLPAAVMVELARDPHLLVPIALAGRTVATLEWGLHFERPRDLILMAAPYPSGVHLRVRLEPSGPSRLTYAVSEGTRRYLAVIEREDASAFHVVSRGVTGSNGHDGSAGTDGLSGMTGMDASCPSSAGSDGGRGGDGSDGSSGSDGGDGGRGGDLLIELACRRGACDDLPALARLSIVSRGGPGGSGGSGGRAGSGGRGGAGGAGATCNDADRGDTTSLAAGRAGSNGSDGRRGSDGATGREGPAGAVEVRTVE
jgi:hypothetical protein